MIPKANDFIPSQWYAKRLIINQTAIHNANQKQLLILKDFYSKYNSEPSALLVIKDSINIVIKQLSFEQERTKFVKENPIFIVDSQLEINKDKVRQVKNMDIKNLIDNIPNCSLLLLYEIEQAIRNSLNNPETLFDQQFFVYKLAEPYEIVQDKINEILEKEKEKRQKEFKTKSAEEIEI
jgi:hypothetical protein